MATLLPNRHYFLLPSTLILVLMYYYYYIINLLFTLLSHIFIIMDIRDYKMEYDDSKIEDDGQKTEDDNSRIDDDVGKLADSFFVNIEEAESEKAAMKTKETVMLLSLKRKAELEAKKIMKDHELSKAREEAEHKREMQEHRKLVLKQRREAILEQYRQKKKAAEAAERDGASSSERSNSSTGSSATNLNGQRGLNTLKSSRSSHHVSAWTLYTGPKLFAKPTIKTNLSIIQNAITKALEGAANAKTLKKMQDTIDSHSKTCGHFLILFRSRNQFRGLYDYNNKQNTITKLEGLGPKTIRHEDILKYYKYDSPKREFIEVQTKHISLTIIAFTIKDHLWSCTLSNRVPRTHDPCQNQRNHYQ